MLTAELLKPNRLNTQGRTWERGVPVPVDLTTARTLARNPRFQVNGLLEAVEALASGKTLEELGIREAPAPAEIEEEESGIEERDEGDGGDLLARIRDAADGLDVDVEENFGPDGKPTVEALSAALGEEITAEQRDAALAPPVKPGQLEAEPKPAAASSRTLRIKSGAKPRPRKKPAAKPVAEKVVEV